MIVVPRDVRGSFGRARVQVGSALLAGLSILLPYSVPGVVGLWGKTKLAWSGPWSWWVDGQP